MPTLFVSEPGQTTRPVAFREAPFVIGRGEQADLRLDDLSVSRRHAEIRSALEERDPEYLRSL